MKFVRIIGLLGVLIPCVSFGAGSSDFQNASNLLKAARRGDARTMQILINAGADVNYVDSTGLSLVCTAVMNNDRMAIQMLQAYGADASKCDRQIKQYRQRTKVATGGEDYNFFSGLSSSHVIALSAVAVAGVIGGVALLTKAFDSDSGGSSTPSGGSHTPGGGGGGGSGAGEQAFVVQYGPAYIDSTGAVNENFDISGNLAEWDTQSASELRRTDFDYFRTSSADNFIADGLNSMLQNYLLVMGGYYSFASGYMGQYVFRNDTSHAPVLAQVEGAQNRPVRVALITGNGINPAGSADSANGITYAISTSVDAATPTVDKYLNNSLVLNNNVPVENELSGFDFSGSGSAFNPFADVNDSALAKIVAGWEGKRSSTDGDLYGFVPNGQLAIYRTGNGTTWNIIQNATEQSAVGTYTDVDSNNALSTGDTIVINGKSYDILTALSQTSISDPKLTINGTTYNLSTNSKIFIGHCVDTTDCTDIAIYVGTDGAWYVNSTGGDDVDTVYIEDAGSLYTYKTQQTNQVHANFTAMTDAVGRTYNVAGETSAKTVDVIANVNVLSNSKKNSYITVDSFTTMADLAHNTDLMDFYSNRITYYYGGNEGGIANTLFSNYSSSKPMIIMPAGDRLYITGNAVDGYDYYTEDLAATFENYAPMLYGNNLKHDFMTIVAVSHETGTSDVSTISGYADGTSSGQIVLSKWLDTTDNNVYSSRKCGLAGSGSSGVDPWCFAASGPTSEMATASAAGAVASVKSAFDYMTNDQVFTLLALTADGPFLSSDTGGKTLRQYLQDMYDLPYQYESVVDSLTDEQYMAVFKDVFGYGLINLERAITPDKSVSYYSSGNIVSSSGNAYWGTARAATSLHASSVFNLTGRGAINASYYDVIESADGTLSLPRVWTDSFSLDNVSKHGLYMGDVLGDFNVGTTNTRTNQFGNMTIDMAMSSRAYNDNMNGLDNLRVAFSNAKFDLDAQYQHYLTDGESRFSGRANGVLALASNSLTTEAAYKFGKFAFGGRAFSGAITDESLLENDPAISNQFEPGRLGFVNGASFDAAYNGEKFGFNIAAGTMHEDNTVLGSLSSGLLALDGADTKYVDAVAIYKPFENVKLSLRGTFANTHANLTGGLISEISDIKSNAFALGADVGGFSFTAAMPLATVGGHMGYGYADFDVVENGGSYEVAMNNAHMEYIDLTQSKRELRFSTYYKQPVGEFTDAGVGLIYRVHPNNTDVFGNESILMFKIQHRLGI